MNKPPFRKLRGYAFDPSLSLKVDTAGINAIVYKVPWEDLYPSIEEQEKQKRREEVKAKERRISPDYRMQNHGPIGEYIEVIDYDPTVNKFYEPVDLNQIYVLAQDGLAPSESNPQFHQQMVYAVAMTTIKNFEKALGRKIIWAPRRLEDRHRYQEYVQRLRIYPHALREANAYYSPQKKALLFGYFSSTPIDIGLQMPGSLVFTCLSHDIIAHETTHAILDGMHRHYNNPTNPDVLAFHEAFSDIVALFQRFSFPEVLKKQIAETRGDLGSQNLLGKLAQEFGTAIGNYSSLRDAIGTTDEKTGQWMPKVPDPDEYRTVLEPHARGSILVAAVFDAFINIYKNRVRDLLRIASNGTGVLPLGELHPDLVNRLSDEASKSASHVLNMCIRAVDYCPPLDITYGEYLRALITADLDLVPDDKRHYRLCFIEAFRRRGIYPQGIKNLSLESLRYTRKPISTQLQGMLYKIAEFLKEYRNEIMYKTDREEIYNISDEYKGGDPAKSLHRRITVKFDESGEFEKLTGLVFTENWQNLGIRTSYAYHKEGAPSFQIQNLRLVSRVGPDNNQVNQIVFSLIQRSGIKLKDNCFNGYYQLDNNPIPSDVVEFWGGCTLIFDLDANELKYAISKPLFDSESSPKQVDMSRLNNQLAYQNGEALMGLNEYNGYFGISSGNVVNEPFAFLHQH